MPFLQIKQRIDDHRPGRAVEIARGFVRQQDLRARRRRPRQRHPLLLSARQLRGVVIAPVAEAERGQFLRRPVESVRRARQLQRRGDVFERGHGGDQVKALKDDAHIVPPEPRQRVFAQRGQIAPQRLNRPAGRPLQPAHDHQERRLAGTGGADDAD